MTDKNLKTPEDHNAMQYNIFKEADHLRATYKLVTSEDHAFLIVLIDEKDLEKGVRVISFDKKKKTPISERKLEVKIRGMQFYFDPATLKLTRA